jgi:hypothetical protein
LSDLHGTQFRMWATQRLQECIIKGSLRMMNASRKRVIACWLIGREIVEDEQKGEKRAGYGKRLIADLSRRLTERCGKVSHDSHKWIAPPRFYCDRQHCFAIHESSA